jgi:four helix bundle protein
MEELDIPIFKKAYELYKSLYELRNGVPKQDRHALWQRIEMTALAIIEDLLLAGQRNKQGKSEPLERASMRLNLLRVLLRLAKDTRVLDIKKYANLQQTIDEIGRMLGGWIKSLRVPNDKAPPPEEFLREERRKCRAEPEAMLSLALPFQLLKLSWSPFHFALTQLPSGV